MPDLPTLPDWFDPRAPGSPYRPATLAERGEAAWERIVAALAELEETAQTWGGGDYGEASDVALAEHIADALESGAAALAASIARRIEAGRAAP